MLNLSHRHGLAASRSSVAPAACTPQLRSPHRGSRSQNLRSPSLLPSLNRITRCSAAEYSDSAPEESTSRESMPMGEAPETPAILRKLYSMQAPKWLYRAVACIVLSGQVLSRLFQGKVHWRNTAEQLKLVGPASLGVALLTSGFVGMVFTIQFVREFAKLGLTRSVGGVLALAMARELTPVVTAIILAGRVGSAFAAELGTMQVSGQMDSLRMLYTDPVNNLFTSPHHVSRPVSEQMDSL
eukprot:gene11856-14961_t